MSGAFSEITSVQRSKTHMSNSSYGVNQMVSNQSPLLSETNTDGITAFNNIPVNFRTKMLNQVIMPITAGAMSTGAQQQYQRGTILFGLHLRRNADNHTALPLYSLCNANESLEMAARFADVSAKQGALFNKLGFSGTAAFDAPNVQTRFETVNNKSSFPIAPKQDMFPLTPAAAASSMTLLGAVHTADSASTGKRSNEGLTQNRVLGVVMKGRVAVPNLWGDVSINDRLGFVVKFVQSSAPSFVNSRGQLSNASDRTTGAFLQITAVCERQASTPIHTSTFGAPGPNDIDSWDPNSMIIQRTYESKFANNYNAYDWDSMRQQNGKIDDAPWELPRYEEGFYLPFGKVFTTSKSPPLHMIQSAHRTFKGYAELLSYAPLDVIVDTMPQNQISCL